jgi:lysozyme
MAQISKKTAGAAIAIPVAVAALAGVIIPQWESGGRMDLTVRQQKIDRAGVYTVCNGVTNLDLDYAWIRPGMKFTEAECTKAFAKILPKYYEPLTDCVRGYAQMPAHRQAALLSAAYNLGAGTICGSSAVRLINQGKVKEGCEALGAFVRANGKVLKGLQNRRFDPKWGEIAWCKRDD